MILYAMVCGYLPFEDSNTNMLYEKIKYDEYEVPNFLSKSVMDLLRGILCKDPLRRLTFTDIKNHSFLRSIKLNKPIKSLVEFDFMVINKMEKQFGFDPKITMEYLV